MPRCKVSRELIANRRARAVTLAKRREGLKKKAQELATLCGVRVALVYADGEGAAPPDVWESEEGVLAAYRALHAEERAAHTHRAYAEAELGKEDAKLARVRQGGPAALPPWDKVLDDPHPEKARQVLEAVDAALAAAEERRGALGMPFGYHDGSGLLQDVAPLRRAAPRCGGSNFVDVDMYPFSSQADGDASGGGYEQTMCDNGVQPSSATGMQPGYRFQQYPGSGAVMDGYQMQMTAGMNGHNDTCPGWDAFQPHHGYASQCYGMSGYRTQHVPSHGGLLQPNLHNLTVTAGYVSLDIGLGYIDTPVAHNAQGYGRSNSINAPPALSSQALGTGDNFTNPAPAQPLAVCYGGDLLNASGYTTQWPAQQQQHQSASSSQQSGIEQLFGDVENTQL